MRRFDGTQGPNYGGSGGIGSATAKFLHARGYGLHLVARSQDKLAAVAGEFDAGYTAGDVNDASLFPVWRKKPVSHWKGWSTWSARSISAACSASAKPIFCEKKGTLPFYLSY